MLSKSIQVSRYMTGVLTMSAAIFLLTALAFWTVTIRNGHADSGKHSHLKQIHLSRVEPETGRGYGYVLQYYVPAPIEAFWRFKTDFNSDILLTSDELIGHRMIESDESKVITENRYATAPGLRFLWQTDIFPDRYRLEFRLLNPKECRHSYHYGSIQLSPDGNHTKVIQTAFFDFKGASIWVKYPWYGGMKSTLTKVAKWEQKMAKLHKRQYLADIRDYAKK